MEIVGAVEEHQRADPEHQHAHDRRERVESKGDVHRQLGQPFDVDRRRRCPDPASAAPPRPASPAAPTPGDRTPSGPTGTQAAARPRLRPHGRTGWRAWHSDFCRGVSLTDFGLAQSTGACSDGPDSGFDVVVRDEQHLVALFQDVVRLGQNDPVSAQHRDQGAVRGGGRSRTRVPTSGLSAGSVSCATLALPCRSPIRRTTWPTSMAPSTAATIAIGVDTATSIPHASVNSHSLRELLTRATTLPTPNSVLASSENVRFDLSSPVAAMTTSQICNSASSSDVSSHASASSHSAPGTVDGSYRAHCCSIRRTLCPLSTSSCATDRPTAPAPPIAIRMIPVCSRLSHHTHRRSY